jgi:hypothetical protein
MLRVPDKTYLRGFCGGADHGKSHVAQKLFEATTAMGRPAVIISFAEPIRLMLSALLRTHLTSQEVQRALFTQEGKRTPLAILQGQTPRHALQTLGTEWGRSLIGPNLWIDIQMEHVRNYMEHGVSVIFDDVRFASEYAAIHDHGGTVVRVFNAAVHDVDGHVSEKLPPFDETYDNDWYGG